MARVHTEARRPVSPPAVKEQPARQPAAEAPLAPAHAEGRRFGDSGLELDELPIQQRVVQSEAAFDEAKGDYRQRAMLHPFSALTDDRGKAQVTLEVNGKVVEQREERWYLDPGNWKRSQGDAKAELIAEGKVGQPIPPHGKIRHGKANPEKQAELATEGKKLGALERDRRLVADLGGKSADGEPVLQFVTALEAVDLIASGKPVFALNGQEPKDDVFHYQVDARNWGNTQKERTEVHWVERSYDYEKVPLTSAADIERVGKGEGLPKGMSGVYRDRGSTTLCVARRSVEEARQFLDNWTQTSLTAQGSREKQHLDPAANDELKPRLEAPREKTFRIGGTERIGAVVGGTIGLGIGMVFPPAAPATAAAGAVVGKMAAKLVSRHEFSNKSMNQQLFELDQRWEKEILQGIEYAQQKGDVELEREWRKSLDELHAKYE